MFRFEDLKEDTLQDLVFFYKHINVFTTLSSMDVVLATTDIYVLVHAKNTISTCKESYSVLSCSQF